MPRMLSGMRKKNNYKIIDQWSEYNVPGSTNLFRMFLGIVVSYVLIPAAPPPAEPAVNPLMRHQDCVPLVLLS